MINAYGQYILFWLFIRLPVFTRANKVTEKSFDFNLQIIYFLEYQNFAWPSSKQEFIWRNSEISKGNKPKLFLYAIQLKCRFEKK